MRQGSPAAVRKRPNGRFWIGKSVPGSLADSTQLASEAVCVSSSVLPFIGWFLDSGGLQHAAAHLVALDRLEQRLEVAFAETVVALALDELEEHGPQLRLRE